MSKMNYNMLGQTVTQYPRTNSNTINLLLHKSVWKNQGNGGKPIPINAYSFITTKILISFGIVPSDPTNRSNHQTHIKFMICWNCHQNSHQLQLLYHLLHHHSKFPSAPTSYTSFINFNRYIIFFTIIQSFHQLQPVTQASSTSIAISSSSPSFKVSISSNQLHKLHQLQPPYHLLHHHTKFPSAPIRNIWRKELGWKEWMTKWTTSIVCQYHCFHVFHALVDPAVTSLLKGALVWEIWK